MKTRVFNLFLIMSLFTAALLFSPVYIAAQSEPVIDAVQTAGENPSVNLTEVFTTIAAFAGVVLIFTSYAKRLMQSNGTWTIVISALISFLLGLIGYLLQIGIFAGVTWLYIFVYGIVATLLANGLSTWPFIADILVLLKLKLPK